MTQTIQEARQQIEQAKREIATREAQGEEARKKLEQTRQSLPDVRSQRALRQQLSGLQGRDFRQKVAGAEKEISGKELEVEQFVKSLEPYKQQVASAEAQVSDIEARQRAIENIQKVAGRSNGELILSMIASKGSGYERKYAREYLENIQSQRDFNEDLTKALEDYNKGNADALNKFGGIEKLEKLKLIKVNEVKLDVPKISPINRPDLALYDKMKNQMWYTPFVEDVKKVFGFQDIKAGVQDIGQTLKVQDFATGSKALASDVNKIFMINQGTTAGINLIDSGLNKVSKVTEMIAPPSALEQRYKLDLQNYERLSKQYDDLTSKGTNAEGLRNFLNQESIRLNQVQEAIRIKRESSPDTLTQNIVRGFVSAPLVLSRDILGFAKNPISKTKEVATGIKNLPTQAKLYPTSTFGSILGQTAFFLTAGAIIKDINAPKTTYSYKKFEPKFTEKQYFVNVGGETKLLGKYNVVQKTKVIKTTTTPFRETFGFNPLNVVTKIRKDVTTTPYWSEVGSNQPVMTFSFRQGSKYGKLGFVSGDSAQLTAERLLSTGSTEKFLLSKIPKNVYTSDLGINIGGIESSNILRVYPKSGEISNIGIPSGRTTNLFQTAEVIKKFTPDGSEVQIFGSKIYFKDVTKPFSRASGNIPTAEGVIIRRDLPNIFSSQIGFQGGGAKSSPKFFQSLNTIQQVQTLPKPIFKPSGTTTSTTIIKPSSSSSLDLNIIAPSVYQGLNQYERTSSSGLGIIPNFKDDVSSKISLIPESKSEIKLIEVLSLNNKQKNPFIDINKSNLGFSTPSKEKFIEKQISNLKVNQATKQELLQKQKIIQTQIQKQTRPQQPKPSSKIIPPTSESFISKIKRILKTPEKIEVFGRRFGKDISLGRFSDKKRAEDTLNRFLRGSLGRSGFLSSGGKKIESDLLKSPVYRRSKKDLYRVVQKSKYSLGSFGEKKEILGFKKRKSKKKSFWIF